MPVVGIGKIEDLFAGTRPDAGHPHDVRRARHGRHRARSWRARRRGLIFVNLVDFDTVSTATATTSPGYAANLERFDARLARCCRDSRADDLLDRHRRSRQRSDDAVDRSLARVRAAAAGGRGRPTPVSISARGRPSPISARRSPSSSACRRSRTARASCAEHPAIDWPAAPAEMLVMPSIREQLEAREFEFLAPAGREERGEPGPARATSRRIRFGPCSSATAIASFTARPSAG